MLFYIWQQWLPAGALLTMVTFPEAVKSVAGARDEGVFTGTVDWN